MRRHWRIGVAMMAATLGACAPADDKALSDADFTTFLTATSAAGLQPSSFTPGEPISFKAVTTNNTDDTQDIAWCDGSRMDIRVYDADDALVWNLYHGMSFVQVVQPDAFGPREERTAEATWGQQRNQDNPSFAPTPVEPGWYYAIATGCAGRDGAPLEGFTSNRVDFVIE